MSLYEVLEWAVQTVKKGFYLEITVKKTLENLRIIKNFKEKLKNEEQGIYIRCGE